MVKEQEAKRGNTRATINIHSIRNIEITKKRIWEFICNLTSVDALLYVNAVVIIQKRVHITKGSVYMK